MPCLAHQAAIDCLCAWSRRLAALQCAVMPRARCIARTPARRERSGACIRSISDAADTLTAAPTPSADTPEQLRRRTAYNATNPGGCKQGVCVRWPYVIKEGRAAHQNSGSCYAPDGRLFADGEGPVAPEGRLRPFLARAAARSVLLLRARVHVTATRWPALNRRCSDTHQLRWTLWLSTLLRTRLPAS